MYHKNTRQTYNMIANIFFGTVKKFRYLNTSYKSKLNSQRTSDEIKSRKFFLPFSLEYFVFPQNVQSVYLS
jgi:hypothetical protein